MRFQHATIPAFTPAPFPTPANTCRVQRPEIADQVHVVRVAWDGHEVFLFDFVADSYGHDHAFCLEARGADGKVSWKRWKLETVKNVTIIKKPWKIVKKRENR